MAVTDYFVFESDSGGIILLSSHEKPAEVFRAQDFSSLRRPVAYIYACGGAAFLYLDTDTNRPGCSAMISVIWYTE